jgi:hypothetical protein
MTIIDTTYDTLEFEGGGGGGGGESGHHEEFLPAAAATYVDLATAPTTIMVVARGGVIQSFADGHYTISGARVTFSTAFTGSERVVIAYTSGIGSSSGVDNDLRAYVRDIMSVLDPGGPPPP